MPTGYMCPKEAISVAQLTALGYFPLLTLLCFWSMNFADAVLQYHLTGLGLTDTGQNVGGYYVVPTSAWYPRSEFLHCHWVMMTVLIFLGVTSDNP